MVPTPLQIHDEEDGVRKQNDYLRVYRDSTEHHGKLSLEKAHVFATINLDICNSL